MTIEFKNILDHVISMQNFELKWRFTDEKYDVLPEQYLNQLKPLDVEASEIFMGYENNVFA
jgi:hypothetical protein